MIQHSSDAEITTSLIDGVSTLVEEFEHMRQWTGPRFNAEAFSVNAANEQLQRRRSLAAK